MDKATLLIFFLLLLRGIFVKSPKVYLLDNETRFEVPEEKVEEVLSNLNTTKVVFTLLKHTSAVQSSSEER